VRPIARGDWQIPGIGVTPHSRVQVSGMKRSSGAAVWSCSTAPAAAPCRQLRGAAPQSCSCSTLIRRPSRGCRSARGCRLHIIADGRRLIAVRTGAPWMNGPSRRHHPQGACGWRRLRMGGGQPPVRGEAGCPNCPVVCSVAVAAPLGLTGVLLLAGIGAPAVLRGELLALEKDI
jgi:hypothetical protein